MTAPEADTLTQRLAAPAPAPAPAPDMSARHAAAPILRPRPLPAPAPDTDRAATDTAAVPSAELSVDTTANCSVDRSADYPFVLYGTPDSLRRQLRAEPPRRAAAEEVFGTRSTIVVTRATTSGVQSLTENPVFQGFVLLLAVVYAQLLYRNLGDVRLLLGRISRDTTSGKRLFDDPGGSGFARFMNTTTAIGVLFLGIMAVKYGDALLPTPLLQRLSHSAVLVLSLLAVTCSTVVLLLQWGFLRLTGGITRSQPFVTQLLWVRQSYFALAVILISPALLLFALCPRDSGGGWFLLMIIELTITIFLYFRETFNLFLSKKISILHWFLYLCTVEIFPISLLWLLVTR